MNVRIKINPLLACMALAMTVNTTTAHAGLSDMQSFFDEVGVYGNATPAAAFQGQTRNYITGGSLTVRIPEKNYQLATFDPPRLSSSACGGIDAFAGSFSFLNSDQLVQMLQNIGNNAAGAVFQLALDSVSPKLGSVIKYFQDMANKVNALNVNSCQAAKGIVSAGMSGSLESGFMNNMKEMGTNLLGTANDWSGIQEAFQTTPEKVKETSATLKGSSSPLTEDEKFWIEPGNLLWRALDKVTSGGTGLSNDEKKIIQAMVGTVVVQESTSTPATLEVESWMPLLLDPLDTFMGSDATSNIAIPVYTCNNVSTCEIVSNTGQTLSISSLRKIIHTKMQVTQKKIMDRSGGISADDYEVVNMSFLPVWTMMEAEYRTGGILGTLDTSEEVIALSYTKALLQRTLKGIRVALQSAKKAKNPGIAMAVKQLEDEIVRVHLQVESSMAEKLVRYNAYLTAKQSLAQEVNRVKERTAQQLTSINSHIR